MLTSIDKLLESGCAAGKRDKVCRSRGGESCAFDGAMIVLQPIADAAHLVHGPIACCGNSWEGRGSLSSKGNLHRMGFTTGMSEMDIVYGSEKKLYNAIVRTHEAIRPKAVFVYATCVSGLIGEDIEAVCKRAETALGIRVIPVNAPGFVGPKNLGNRIAGEVLLDYVIGTGEPPVLPLSSGRNEEWSINLIGEYNIAGDLWLVEPLLKEAGINILSRLTGDAAFEEITYAHRARLNVIVCGRALINVAKEMERRYGIPYIEASFFGKTETSKALGLIASNFKSQISGLKFAERIESIIAEKEKQLAEKLKAYEHLRGKKAVLYTGGVKSWSFISALMDLGIETVAVGTKKSAFEDEEKMKEILGEDAPLVEDTTPKNLLRLLKEKSADMLIAGGRNQYLAIKEGYPFVDVNQERHTAYAGYDGLVNLAEDISNSLKFYGKQSAIGNQQPVRGRKNNPDMDDRAKAESCKLNAADCLINPLKHSPAIGAAIAFQGIDNALPVIHGAQGCSFLAKVLLTKHFREPIALASTKLFAEEVVMGSDEKLVRTIEGFIEKNRPDLIGVLTSGLSEVKGDDVEGMLKGLDNGDTRVLHVSTPDYAGGLEAGYAKAIEAVVEHLVGRTRSTVDCRSLTAGRLINVLAGAHLTPADFTELRETIEAFGLRPIILPDLSALDGSRQGISTLASGGATADEIKAMGSSAFTIALGASLAPAAKNLKDRSGIEYRVFESIAGLKDTDMFMETLSMLSGNRIPAKYERQRKILLDGMRDAHFHYSGKRACIALEHDLGAQTGRWLREMGAEVFEVDADCGDLFTISGEYDLLISNCHAEDTAKRLGVPLYRLGFPVYKTLGNTQKVSIGYKGTLGLINDAANALGGAQ